MLRIDEADIADVKLVKASGGLDQGGSGILQDRLLALIRRPGSGLAGVVLDLREVPLISSAGLRMLMIATKEYGKQRVKLAVAGLSPCVREVFKISRFDKVIKTHDTIEAALATVSPRAAAAYQGGRPA